MRENHVNRASHSLERTKSHERAHTRRAAFGEIGKDRDRRTALQRACVTSGDRHSWNRSPPLSPVQGETTGLPEDAPPPGNYKIAPTRHWITSQSGIRID